MKLGLLRLFCYICMLATLAGLGYAGWYSYGMTFGESGGVDAKSIASAAGIIIGAIIGTIILLGIFRLILQNIDREKERLRTLNTPTNRKYNYLSK